MDFESYGELSDGLSLGDAAVQYDLQLIRKSDLRTNRVALSNRRIVAVDAQHQSVTFT